MEAVAKRVKLAKKKLNQVNRELSTTLFGTQYDVTSGNINEVHIRLEALNTLSEKYEMAQIEIEELDDSVDGDQQCDKYIDFKNKLYHAKAVLMQLIDANSNNTSSSPSYGELTKYKTENTMRLPPVEIPKFDGECWTSFIDSFNIVFHNHENLAPVQKFHYFKGYLVGQASDVIRSIPITGANYLQYNTLMNRYENKGVIIQSHIRSLLDTPKVLIASATNLEKLQHHVMSNANAVRALGQPIESWDAWLVTLICSRLDSATMGEWQLQYNKKELPSFCEFEAFLLNRIAAYQEGEMNVGYTIENKAVGKVYNYKLQEKRHSMWDQLKNQVIQLNVVCVMKVMIIPV